MGHGTWRVCVEGVSEWDARGASGVACNPKREVGRERGERGPEVDGMTGSVHSRWHPAQKKRSMLRQKVLTHPCLPAVRDS
jgi:hypothetical protein